MYPTNEVRLAAVIERHHERARHRRAISAAQAPSPTRIGRWITEPSSERTSALAVVPAAQSST
jgi:hypothetical protein